jgi:quinol monooxygenase YgiN
MSVYSIWEGGNQGHAGNLRRLRWEPRFWQDMLAFDGYLAHELVQDLDEYGHLIVISQWASREAADAALSCAAHPNATLVNALVSKPRRRIVAAAL